MRSLESGGEAALVAALKRGEDTAFRALVRDFAPQLYAVARRFMGNDADAQDCLQETLLQVYRKIDQFEGRSALATWMHRILVNRALGKLRQASHDETSLDPLQPRFDAMQIALSAEVEPGLSVDELLQREGTRMAVRQAIDQLPATHRSVLLLRDIEGIDTKATAALLEISEAAAKVRLHRARHALKRLLEPLFREGEL